MNERQRFLLRRVGELTIEFTERAQLEAWEAFDLRRYLVASSLRGMAFGLVTWFREHDDGGGGTPYGRGRVFRTDERRAN